jgi:hypothetical protein
MFLGAGARSKTSVRQRLTLKLAAALVNTTPSDGSVSASKLAASALGSGVSMINGVIANSAAGNALTVSLKTLAGTDPTASDPIYIVFRDAAAGGGNYSVLTITSAISLTISSGSTLGAVSGTPFKLWLVCFNDSGTPRLALINCLNPNPWNIYPLGQIPIASSTAEGGAGAADSVWTFYSGVAVTSKAYSVLGYYSFEGGLATAGTWATTATRLELFRPWTPLPGALISQVQTFTGAVATGTTAIPNDDTIPQITEGNEFMTQSIQATSAANVFNVEAQGSFAHTASARMIMALFQDAAANALAAVSQNLSATVSTMGTPIRINYDALCAGTSPTTFRIRAGGTTGATTTFNGEAGGRIFGGAIPSFLRVRELMA